MLFTPPFLDRYPCPLCDDSFRRERLRADHLLHTHDAVNTYLCHKCASTHCSQSALDRHYRQTHYSPLARLQGCKSCHFKTSAQTEIARHGEHDHSCNKCCEQCGFRGSKFSTVAGSVHFLHVHETARGCALCGEVWTEGQSAGHMFHRCSVQKQTRGQRRLVKAERRKALELSRKAAELAKAAAEGKVECRLDRGGLDTNSRIPGAALAAQRINSPTSNLPHKPTPKPSGFNSDHDAFLALQMTEFAKLPKQEQEDMLDPVKRHQRGVLGAKGEYADELADEEDYGALAKFAD